MKRLAVLLASLLVFAGCAGDDRSDEQRVTDGIKGLLTGHPDFEGQREATAVFSRDSVGHPTAIECRRGLRTRLHALPNPTWGCRVRYRDGRRTECEATIVHGDPMIVCEPPGP